MHSFVMLEIFMSAFLGRASRMDNVCLEWWANMSINDSKTVLLKYGWISLRFFFHL